MTSFGLMLLVASAATGFDGKAHIGGLGLFRHSAVQEGAPPPGGPLQPGAMGGQGAAPGRRFPNVRSQVVFFGPGGPQGAGDVKIGWQTGAGNGEKVYLPGRPTPFRYNVLQGYIYRLKMSDISGRGNLTLYPTIEVAPSTPATDAYLTHNQIPVQFTAEDLDQVEGGNFVTKVIYLPDPKYQELAVANVETLVSTRLDPGVDPILEADKRGTILMIVRLGGINLEMDAPGGATAGEAPPVMMAPAGGAPTMMPPGSMPTGAYSPPAPPAAPVVNLEAPASPVVPAAPAVTPPAPADVPAPAPAPPTPGTPGV
jgi:hypothetical protein